MYSLLNAWMMNFLYFKYKMMKNLSTSFDNLLSYIPLLKVFNDDTQYFTLYIKGRCTNVAFWLLQLLGISFLLPSNMRSTRAYSITILLCCMDQQLLHSQTLFPSNIEFLLTSLPVICVMLHTSKQIDTSHPILSAHNIDEKY